MGTARSSAPLQEVIVLASENRRRRSHFNLFLTIAAVIATICFLGVAMTHVISHGGEHHHHGGPYYHRSMGFNEEHHHHMHHDEHHHMGMMASNDGKTMQIRMAAAELCENCASQSPGEKPEVCSEKEWKNHEFECKFEGYEIECKLIPDEVVQAIEVECELENKTTHQEIKFKCQWEGTTCSMICGEAEYNQMATFLKSEGNTNSEDDGAKILETVKNVMNAWRPAVIM